MAPPYGHHGACCKHYAPYRPVDAGSCGQWLLKMPFHLMELEAPDPNLPGCLFIQTTAPRGSSWARGSAWRRDCGPPQWIHGPRHELGAEQLALMVRLMDRAMDFRQAHPELEDRWLDLSYYDLVEDPMAMVEIVYDHLHWDLGPAVAASMDDWLLEQSLQRQSEPPHEYDLADYGLSRASWTRPLPLPRVHR